MTIPISSFHPTQKHSSWIKVPVNEWPNDERDGVYIWKSPISYPDDDKAYTWDDDLYQSDNTKGWVIIE